MFHKRLRRKNKELQDEVLKLRAELEAINPRTCVCENCGKELVYGWKMGRWMDCDQVMVSYGRKDRVWLHRETLRVKCERTKAKCASVVDDE